jgi:DNA invertase Pin-like site-specific DNA recombinase
MKRDAVVYLNTRKKGEYEDQMAAVEEYARYRFSINQVFHDHRARSVPPAQRTSYRQMVDYTAANNVKNVIFYTIPEFSKNIDHALRELKSLTSGGYTVLFARQNFIGYTENPEQRKEAMLSFIEFMEQYQNTTHKTSVPRSRQAKKGTRSIGRPKALDTGQRDALITVRRAGTSIGQICKMFNVSRSTVNKILTEYPELKGEWKGNAAKTV